MCGIIGSISFDKLKNSFARKDVMAQAFVTGAIRGYHSTGLFGVRLEKDSALDNVLVYKKDVAGYDFVQLKQTERVLTNIEQFKFLIGHHRHATFGSVVSKNAHPFTHEHITLVHNGSLTHLASLTSEHNKFDVDSEVLTYAIATKGHEAILKKIKGPAAIVWYDSKADALFLYRNKERPLYFAKIKDADTTFIASEAWMIKGLIWRNGLELEQMYEVAEHQLVTFNDKALPTKVEVIEPEIEVHTYHQNRYNPANAAPYHNTPYEIGGPTWVKGKRRVPINTEGFLKDNNLTVGNKIHFIVDAINPPASNSKHGKAIGFMTKTPFLDVNAPGTDMRKYKPKDILHAEITGVEMAAHGMCPALVVKIIKKVGADKGGLLSNVLHLPFVKADPLVLLGPNKKEVSREEFIKLTEAGCDNCTGVVNPAFHEKVLWTTENKPICHECSEELTSHGAIKH